ncbi:MAG: hypothetical protein RI993_467 [Pseudomonadota bacterium]|jgi:hypothetical protein
MGTPGPNDSEKQELRFAHRTLILWMVCSVLAGIGKFFV